MAQSAEAEKIDFQWVFRKIDWSIKPQTPYSSTPDEYLTEAYQRLFDPLETVGFIDASKMNISFEHDAGKYGHMTQ
ncbi:MAG: hypothetical protein L0H53_07195 [Candidatus Nitrosocosmicus sp.]|nr:hypothetical protein [Candidatus Nitrosocosmicus sp.]MDN5867687.1 hypothetical protein [Candidatus Nitrosocosmicus sp.]